MINVGRCHGRIPTSISCFLLWLLIFFSDT
uniref:Uncharacterized protein n=1 Tax=Rhizophora mucronata TaxID=61149 RepID=A0A2P2R4G0_RHIMU